MQFGEIKNRAVVSLGNAEKLGLVDDLLLDASARQVLGFRVRRGGLIAKREALLLGDVRAIGEDALTVDDPGRMNGEDQFSAFQGATAGSNIIGSRMITQSGSVVGTIGDIEADFATGAVQGFTLSGSFMNRLRHESQSVSIDAVRTVGEKLVVVADDTLPAQT